VSISGASGGTKLRDPFKKVDGTRITHKADWVCGKAENRTLADKDAYGEKKTGSTTTGTMSGSGISVSVSAGGRSASFSASISGAGSGAGVIVFRDFGADTGTMRSAGAAIINNDPFTCGCEDTGRGAKSGAYYTVRSSSSTGYLAAWSWGVRRIIDGIAASGGTVLKADAIGVSSCSRYGKGGDM
jgi:hypothetical protein